MVAGAIGFQYYIIRISKFHVLLLLLCRLISMMHFNSKAMPAIDTDYSYHIIVAEFLKPIIWGPYHVTSLH